MRSHASKLSWLCTLGLLATLGAGAPGEQTASRATEPAPRLLTPEASLQASPNEIDVPAETPLGKFVRVKAIVPEPANPAIEIRVELSIDAPAGAAFDVYDCGDGRELLVTGTPGTYTARLTLAMYETITTVIRDPEFPDDIKKATLVDRKFRVDEDRDPIVATFAIVGPTPPPKPEPEVPPAPESGPRDVYLIHEAMDVTPAFALLESGLRLGDGAKYLKEHGHTLTILDDDEEDGRGNPASPLAKYAAILADTARPTLIIVDPKTQAVVAKAALTPETTAQNVVEAIRRAGG